MVGGVSVKKNELTDKHYGKGSKGFYAALGISAVMIGAASLFAHKQGDRLPKENNTPDNKTVIHESAYDRNVTNIPQTSAVTSRRLTTAVTAPVTTELPQETITAEEITVDAPFMDNSFFEQAQPAAADLSAAVPPLADMSSILSDFSSGELVKNETTGTWQTHNGTDIAAEVGADVFAVADGKVQAVANDALWGVTVVIDHNNGYISKYRSLGSDLNVQKDDEIKGGDVIGYVGETADIESGIAPHLHIEITHNGKYIDPMSIIGDQ